MVCCQDAQILRGLGVHLLLSAKSAGTYRIRPLEFLGKGFKALGLRLIGGGQSLQDSMVPRKVRMP